MKKQILVFILFAVIVASCFTFIGCVDLYDTKASEGLNFYSWDDGKSYSVIGIGSCEDTNIVIPRRYKGKPVTSIYNGAFSRCESIESITIPNSVTSIGSRAFAWSSIKSITIPNSVTEVGSDAFAVCSNLTNVTFAGGCKLTGISEGMFSWCARLTQITIPSSVTSIGYEAFANCERLASITIPGSVTTIGESAFKNCEGMTNVIISNGVTSIGEYAFYKCIGLTIVTIPASVTRISAFAFDDCTNLSRVVFEDPQGWYRNVFDHTYGGTSVTLTDPTQNAIYLTDTFSSNDYWYKTN